MRQSKWFPLYITQYLGVMNDNLLKHLIIFIAASWVAEDSKELVISAAAAMLVIPYILFSPLAGRLAQIKSKQKILEWAKLVEIPIMVLAIGGFYVDSLAIVMAAMFLMGVQSALYSPAKYGLIRDVGGVAEISQASGFMELLTFMGVLLGTVAAGYIADMAEFRREVVAGSLLILAVIGYITSKLITVKEEAPDREELKSLWPLKFVWDTFRWSKKVAGLNYTVLGLGFFWLIASLLQLNIIVHLQEGSIYGLASKDVGLVNAGIAVSMGIGCWAAGLLSKQQVELGLVPVGGVAMAIGSTIMALVPMALAPFLAVLFATAFFAGFFKIPLNAWMQERVPGRHLGKVLAYNNNVVFIFLLLSAAVLGYVGTIGNSYDVFKVTALCAWVIVTVMWLVMPEMRKRVRRAFDRREVGV
jgi:acyl-[acyl-carrier-protein]-phospholipid O-acyltransferase/long-chain-fatty-acid--[acyl-carrier-protein] ligase